MECEKLILEIVKLVMQLNAETDLAVFFHISGHVETIDVDVCEDKEINYKRRFASLSNVGLTDFDKLMEVRDMLKTFF